MAGPTGRGAGSRPNCLSCVHYHITWEPRTPHGCRALGFKSRFLPHVHVQNASGSPCHSFEPRPKPRRPPGY